MRKLSTFVFRKLRIRQTEIWLDLQHDRRPRRILRDHKVIASREALFVRLYIFVRLYNCVTTNGRTPFRVSLWHATYWEIDPCTVSGCTGQS